MQIITQNPYRVLGLLANSTERELQKQISRLQRYAEIGKTAPSDFDFEFIGKVSRTGDDVQLAASKIEQAHKKVAHALNWFITITDFDAIALNHLKQGNIEKAIKIWSNTSKTEVTSRSYSSYANLSTLYCALAFRNNRLNLAKLEQGLELKDQLYRSRTFQEFCEMIGGKEVVVDGDDVRKQFVDDVITTLDPFMGSNRRLKSSNTLSLFSRHSENIKKYVLEKQTSIEFTNITSKIEETEKKRNNNRDRANEAGEQLYQSTVNEINFLKSLTGSVDIKLQFLINNLAEELKVCAIVYFNALNDDWYTKPAKTALKIANYALEVGPTGVVKTQTEKAIEDLEGWL